MKSTFKHETKRSRFVGKGLISQFLQSWGRRTVKLGSSWSTEQAQGQHNYIARIWFFKNFKTNKQWVYYLFVLLSWRIIWKTLSKSQSAIQNTYNKCSKFKPFCPRVEYYLFKNPPMEIQYTKNLFSKCLLNNQWEK